MTLIDEVKELKSWSEDPNETFESGDVCPEVFSDMLDVLGAFQEGDAAILQGLYNYRTCKGIQGIETDCLRRLAEAARKMEARKDDS